jgi:hypothetical protein
MFEDWFLNLMTKKGQHRWFAADQQLISGFTGDHKRQADF